MSARAMPEPWTKIPLQPQASAFEGYAETAPVKFWYWDTGGDGEVIVLNHPWSVSSEGWGYQQPVLAKAGYRVIAWSRRGTYKTERGPMDDLGTSAADQKQLLDHLGIDKCHMVGCAAGGVTSIHFALEHPERLHSLTLACSVLLPDEADFDQMRARTSLPKGHNTSMQFLELGSTYRGANPEGVKQWLAIADEAHPEGVFTAQPWGSQPLTWARMEKLNVPVLLLTGDGDHFATAATKRLFAQHLPNRELAVIDEAGHSAYWEQPEAFNAAVLDFVGRHAAGKPATPPAKNVVSGPPWRTTSSSRAPMPDIIAGPVKIWDNIPVPAQVPAKEGYADTKPVKLWYWDTGGDGEAIVFCHPWSQSSACWKYQQPVLAKAGYRVIAWSQRGFYKTEKGPEDDVGSSADDLAQLLDWLKVDKLHLVGVAAGGVTAVSYAINHPERLLSLVLSGTILLPDEPAYAAFRNNQAAAPAGVKTSIPSEFYEVGGSYRAGNDEGLAAWKELEHLSQKNGAYRSQPWGATRTFANFSKITVPTLLQTGDTDVSTPPSLQRLYFPHFPNAELRIINECGHAPYWEQPEVFNASLLEFIGKHGAKSG